MKQILSYQNPLGCLLRCKALAQFFQEILLFLIIQAVIRQDSIIALISAMCGITYTFIAGKGYPICYFFGVSGSSFYSFLSFQNALWGNLLLYACYYIPMQILGFIRWNKHISTKTNTIVKIKLSNNHRLILLGITSILTLIAIYILKIFMVHSSCGSVCVRFIGQQM